MLSYEPMSYPVLLSMSLLVFACSLRCWSDTLVGAARLELAPPCSQGRCATAAPRPNETWLPRTELPRRPAAYEAAALLAELHGSETWWIGSALHRRPSHGGDQLAAGALLVELPPRCGVPSRGPESLLRLRALRAHGRWTIGGSAGGPGGLCPLRAHNTWGDRRVMIPLPLGPQPSALPMSYERHQRVSS